MRRGSTPTLTFGLPFEGAIIDKLAIHFKQKGKMVIEKKLADCAITGNKIKLRLTETETLSLDSSNKVEIQLRVGIGNERLVSDIIVADVERILKDGVLD